MDIELKMTTGMEGPDTSIKPGDTRTFGDAEAIRLVQAGFGEPTDRKAFNARKAELEAEANAGKPNDTDSGDDTENEEERQAREEAEAAEAKRAEAYDAAKIAADNKAFPEDLADSSSKDGLVTKARLVEIAAEENIELDGDPNKPEIAVTIMAERALAEDEGGEG